jgi:hypothetical protein
VYQVWGNQFGSRAARAFMDTLQESSLTSLKIDIKPYQVDNVHMVALVTVV